MKKIGLGLLMLISNMWGGDSLELLIAPETIRERIQETAIQLEAEYRGEQLTLIMIMKGAICITADLIRSLPFPCSLESIQASSYGKNGNTPGELYITGIEKLDLKGKNVLVVDDILDTGRTLYSIMERLKTLGAKSLKSLVLLTKNVPRSTPFLPDFSLFTIEDRFVIGYGLDFKEHYRNLPGIYAFINDTPPFQ